MIRKTINANVPVKQGAPRRYDPEVLAKKLSEYIDETEDPMIEEFCLIKNNPTKDTLYRLEKECKNLSYAIKSLHAKQQIRTVKKVESGDMNSTWAIFKMKQKCYGWTDRQEVEVTQEKPFEINIKVID